MFIDELGPLDREVGPRPLRAIAWVLPVLVGACAGVPRDASLPINDPNEQTNRSIFEANRQCFTQYPKSSRRSRRGLFTTGCTI